MEINKIKFEVSRAKTYLKSQKQPRWRDTIEAFNELGEILDQFHHACNVMETASTSIDQLQLLVDRLRDVCQQQGRRGSAATHKLKDDDLFAIVVLEVAEVSEMPVDDILGRKRHQGIVMARTVSIRLMYEYMGQQAKVVVADKFGVNHATVIHALRKFDTLPSHDQLHKLFDKAEEALKKRLENLNQ